MGPFSLRLRACRAHRFSGWRQFEIDLRFGRVDTTAPVLWGVFSAGGKGVQAWFDCAYRPRPTMADGSRIDLGDGDIEVSLFTVLCGVLPPNGHVMISCEGRDHQETHRALRVHVPAVATRLGAALFRAGFRGGFKDWYFAEGGREGPVKLQANKPRDAAHEAHALKRTEADLGEYLARPISALYPDVDARGRERARQILSLLREGRRTRP